MPSECNIFDEPEYQRLEDLIWYLASSGSEIDLDRLIPPNRPYFRPMLERVLRRAQLQWVPEPCADDPLALRLWPCARCSWTTS